MQPIKSLVDLFSFLETPLPMMWITAHFILFLNLFQGSRVLLEFLQAIIEYEDRPRRANAHLPHVRFYGGSSRCGPWRENPEQWSLPGTGQTMFLRHGCYGLRPYCIENTVDETTMRDIAKISNGEFFRVTDNQALKNVFEKIDQYEKAEIKETRFKDTADFYFVYLRWAMLLLLIWLLLKSSFLSNVLQD